MTVVDDLDKLEKLERNPIVKESPSYGGAAQYSLGDPDDSDDEIKESDPSLLPKTDNGHYPALDITRIVCICLVTVDHGGTTFGVWNSMFVQAWVLQYLFIICGVCYGLSSRPVGSYLSRLGMYFVIGVTCNWLSWLVMGLDWRHNMWNVIFQFFFVLALMLFVVLLAPLKGYLARVRDQRKTVVEVSLLESLALLVFGYILVRVVFGYALIPLCQVLFAGPLAAGVQHLGPQAQYWGLPSNSTEAVGFIAAFLTYFQLSATSLYIIVVFPVVCPHVSYVGWLVILNTYLHRCILYRAQEARMINGFDVTTLGLTCFYFGLAHRRVVGKYLVRYWFVFLFVCCNLWPPGMHGRLDESPPTDLATRIGYNLLEMMFTVLFLTAIERMIDPKIFTKDRLQFLGNWALLLFLVHKAVHVMLGGYAPLNWIVLLALAPLCYLCQKPSNGV